jgi:crotonyl-CoA carboxylase/reductase
MQVEVLPTWALDSHDVLVLVMAAGVNYNGVWAALGTPISPLDVHKNPYHVAGSDAAGIVYAVGSKVKRWKVGDEVVIHCNQDDGDDENTTAAIRCSRRHSASGATRRPTAPSPSSAACRIAS